MVSVDVDLPDAEDPISARWMMFVSSRQGISRHVVRMTHLRRLDDLEFDSNAVLTRSPAIW